MGGPIVLTVKIRLEGNGISAKLTEIREWLIEHGLEPNAFNYRMDAHGVLCRADFRLPSEAAAFAEAFAGLIVA
jgi:hypothetical protein